MQEETEWADAFWELHTDCIAADKQLRKQLKDSIRAAKYSTMNRGMPSTESVR